MAVVVMTEFGLALGGLFCLPEAYYTGAVVIYKSHGWTLLG